jgi:hypothetical protein
MRSIKYNKEDSAHTTQILNNIHQYGTIEQIMEKIDHEKKERATNIKGNFYVYRYKHDTILIQEKRTQTDQYRNALYDMALRYMNTPT